MVVRKAQPATLAAPDEDAPWLSDKFARDETAWKFEDVATTEFATQLLTTDWIIDAGTGLAVLPLTTALAVRYDSHGCELLARSAIRKLYQQAFQSLRADDGTRRIAILGNPGIGKSRSLFYALRLLMGGSNPDDKEKDLQHLIIFQSTAERTLFAFVPPGQDRRGGEANTKYHVYSTSLDTFRVKDCVALQNSKTFYLVDPAAASTCPAIVPAKTMSTCSPDPLHYKEWVKDQSRTFYCSVYELPELVAALPHLRVPD